MIGTASLLTRLLDVIEDEIAPLTRVGVARATSFP